MSYHAHVVRGFPAVRWVLPCHAHTISQISKVIISTGTDSSAVSISHATHVYNRGGAIRTPSKSAVNRTGVVAQYTVVQPYWGADGQYTVVQRHARVLVC